MFFFLPNQDKLFSSGSCQAVLRRIYGFQLSGGAQDRGKR